MANQFGKVSTLHIDVSSRDSSSYLKDCFFTAPYKIMKPFPIKNGGIQIMLQTASAGVMDGDQSEFEFRIEEGAKLEFVSQSYEKLHPMTKEGASRKTRITVEKNSEFIYYPLPVIPFANSDFENDTCVELEENATFKMVEILTCGRYGSGERFEYSAYKSRVQITRDKRMVYYDNTCFIPKLFDMNGMGMFEGYTHLCNIFLSKSVEDGLRVEDESCEEAMSQVEVDSRNGDIRQVDRISQIRRIINSYNYIDGGVSLLNEGDIAVRILGKRAQVLEECAKEILTYDS